MVLREHGANFRHAITGIGCIFPCRLQQFGLWQAHLRPHELACFGRSHFIGSGRTNPPSHIVSIVLASAGQRPRGTGPCRPVDRSTSWSRPVMSASRVRREKAALSSGCEPTRRTLQPEATGAVMEATKAPPDERAVNRYAQPNATAPHSYSTDSGRFPSAWGAAKGAKSPRKGGFQRLGGIRGVGTHPVGRASAYRW